MGRKPLGDKKRSREIRIRLTDAEWEKLKAKATKAGYKKLGTWLRQIGLDG